MPASRPPREVALDLYRFGAVVIVVIGHWLLSVCHAHPELDIPLKTMMSRDPGDRFARGHEVLKALLASGRLIGGTVNRRGLMVRAMAHTPPDLKPPPRANIPAIPHGAEVGTSPAPTAGCGYSLTRPTTWCRRACASGSTARHRRARRPRRRRRGGGGRPCQSFCGRRRMRRRTVLVLWRRTGPQLAETAAPVAPRRRRRPRGPE